MRSSNGIEVGKEVLDQPTEQSLCIFWNTLTMGQFAGGTGAQHKQKDYTNF
jgi:hypothetical protein